MVPQAIKQLYANRGNTVRNVLNTPVPERIERGQIWSTQGSIQLPDGRSFKTDEPRIVIIIDINQGVTRASEQLTALPLSIDTHMASEFDLLVPATDNSLKYEFMIEVWNELPIFEMQLKRFLGTLSPQYISYISSLYTTYLMGEQNSHLSIGQVGYPLMGREDVRVRFQETETRAVEYLAQAASAIVSNSEVLVTMPVKVTARQPVLLPNVEFSWKKLLERLREIGIPKSFVLKRLAPATSRVQDFSLSEQNKEGEMALVTYVAERVQKIFNIDLTTLFSTTPLNLDVSFGNPRFKKPKNHNERIANAYTFYAHYLSLLVLQATPDLKTTPLPTRAKDLHQEIIQTTGSVTFENVLHFAWQRGVAVLPLNDSGNFHGACWRENYRNIIVIKPQVNYDAYWLFNLLHEIKHAADSPEQSDLSVVEAGRDKEWLILEDEQKANDFAGNIMLEGRAIELVQECVKEARHEARNLKSAVLRVSKREHVRTDALANYLAYRLQLEQTSWWDTAANLQVHQDYFALTRNVLIDHLNFDLLTQTDRSLLLQALEMEE